MQTNSPEWLEWRRSGIGASDVPQILLPAEHRPYGGPWEVWLSKRGEGRPLEGAHLEAGHRIERSIVEYVVDQTEGEYTGWRMGSGLQHPEHEWMRATPDAWLGVPVILGGVVTDRGGCALVEAKLTRKHRAWEHGPPPHVVLQMHWQAIVTGCHDLHVGAFLAGSLEYKHWRIDYDVGLAERIAERVYAWRERYIIEDTPPPIEPTDAAMRWYGSRPKGAELRAEDHDVTNAVAAYVMAAENAREAAKEAREAKAMVLALCDGFGGIQTPTGVLYANDVAGRKTLDRKALEKDHPELAAKYTKHGAASKRFTWKANDPD